MQSNFNNISVYKLKKYIYLTVLLAALIMTGYLGYFAKKNVYIIYTFDPSALNAQRNIHSGDINMEKFDQITERLKNKMQRNSIEKINNIFMLGETDNEEGEQPGEQPEDKLYF